MNDAALLDARSAVGNDVIDLQQEDHHAAFQRPRILKRICSPDEAQRVQESARPEQTFWGLFAAKEAAFKAVIQWLGQVPLCYPEFRVSLDQRTVEWRDVRLKLEVRSTERFVHALAWSGTGFPSWALRATRGGQSSSQRVRQLLLDHAARRLGLSADQLAVRRIPRAEAWDGAGPPELMHRGRPLQIPVSLSHDGNLIACALGITCGVGLLRLPGDQLK